MNKIISRLIEYENDIKLVKNAILVLEKNFSKVKNDIIKTYNKESKVNNNKPNKKNIKKTKYIMFKKSSITLSNKVKDFFNINDINNYDSIDSNNKILVSELNKIINVYLIEKDLIKYKKVYLNKELKMLLKTKKGMIELDELLNIIIKVTD